MHFYQQITQATEGRLKTEWKESVIDCLGRLLYDREITIKTYRKALNGLKTSIFVEDTNALDDFKDLAKICNALHREAAAIEVLAKTIRTRSG
jgi:hypothetical protein